MNLPIRSVCVAVAAAGWLAVGAPRASADYLTLNLSSTPNGSATVALDGHTYSNVLVGPYFWTDTNRPPTPGFSNPISTFCIELDRVLQSNTSYVFGTTDPATAPTINSAAKADAIMELYGKHYNPAWGSPGTFADGAGAAAFQLALWELVYDGASGDPNSLGDGRFTVAGFPEVGVAQGWLSGLTGDPSSFYQNLPGQSLVALIAPAPGAEKQTDGQDQITIRPSPVPAPPAVILAGVGLIALAGRARRLRAAAQSA